MTRSELINLMLVRTAPVERAQLRRTLDTKSTEELEQMHLDIFLEAAEDELIKIQAERAANRVMHQLETQRAQEPHRKAEDRRQLAEDRKTFLEACRHYHIGSTEANFSLIRSTLGPGFSAYDIGQALQSGTLHVSPATLTEVQEWSREAEEQRQETLRNMSTEELRSVVRHEAEQRRIQAQREEDQRQVAARQAKDEAFGFPALPDINAVTGEKLNSAYFIRLSNTDLPKFKNYIRMYGASQITRALREKV